MEAVPAHVALDDLQRPWPRRPRPHAAGLDEVLQLEREGGAETVREEEEDKLPCLLSERLTLRW